MKDTIRRSLLVCTVFILFFGAAHAETILLTSGKTVEGDIVEVTDEYVQLDFYGVALKYELKDVATIDGVAPAVFVVKEQTGEATNAGENIPQSRFEQIVTYFKETNVLFDAFSKEMGAMSAEYAQASMRNDPRQIEQVRIKINSICDVYRSKFETLNVPSACASLHALALRSIELERSINTQYAQGNFSDESLSQEVAENTRQMSEEQMRIMRVFAIKKSDIVSQEEQRSFLSDEKGT